MTNEVEIVDNPVASRYEARIGEAVAGLAEYVVDGATIVFTHTETDPAYGGRGIGGTLARTALDTARATGRRVVPRCPFIASWIRKHPDYQDLVE